MPIEAENEAPAESTAQALDATEATTTHDLFAVVVKGSESERPVAIGVEQLVDQHEVVVKSLSGFLGRTDGVAGATIMGDGQVVLIVDVPSLIKKALQRAPETSEGERSNGWQAA